jgi:hypothetical protein
MPFKFPRQLFLITNGCWTPDVPCVGADVRRVTRLTFDVRFVDEAVGPNEMKKDSAVKQQLSTYFAEFWFMVRVFWLVEQRFPKSDCKMPKPPNTVAMAAQILGAQEWADRDIGEDVVKAFIDTRLMTHELNAEKPATSSEIDAAFGSFMQANMPGFTCEQVRQTLRGNDQVELEFPARGGHVGFTAGLRPWNPWYYGEWRAAEFLGARQLAGVHRRLRNDVRVAADHQLGIRQVLLEFSAFDALGNRQDHLVDRCGDTRFFLLAHDVTAERVELCAASLLPVLKNGDTGVWA